MVIGGRFKNFLTMAADVQQTPTFRKDYSHSFTDSVTKETAGPFRATQIWNEIIDNLKERVEIKRRKVMMKTYDHCFTGADAVDIVLYQLLTDKDSFPNKDITREKAVKLCQFMLEQEIFQAVRGHKSEEKASVFEDSQSKFYRFLANKENNANGVRCQSCQELFKPDLVASDYPVVSSSSNKSTSSMSSLLHRHHGVVQELLELTGTWRRRNSDAVKRKLAPSHLFMVGTSGGQTTKGRLSLPAGGLRVDFGVNSNLDGLEKLTPEVEEELMREHALSQLLTLLDIPILDNILSYEAMMTKSSTKQRAYSNLAFKRSDSIISMYSNSSDKEDMWWNAAVECVSCLPRSKDILDDSLGEFSDLTQKLRLYQSIADYYVQMDKPMWSEKFVDIHVGLLNLLMQGRQDQVFKGLCLAVILLPSDVQEELKRLLRFLHQAVLDGAISLSSTEDNRTKVAHVFTPVIIRNKMLTPHQASQLVMFMVDHADNLWEAPDEVEEAVRKSLLELQEGKESQMAVKTYCSQVSKEEFKRQQEQLTEKSLVDLMNIILDSTKMSLKDKKQKLKHFQKHHPAIYRKHFTGVL